MARREDRSPNDHRPLRTVSFTAVMLGIVAAQLVVVLFFAKMFPTFPV